MSIAPKSKRDGDLILLYKNKSKLFGAHKNCCQIIISRGTGDDSVYNFASSAKHFFYVNESAKHFSHSSSFLKYLL
jgi:hypothetical protein